MPVQEYNMEEKNLEEDIEMGLITRIAYGFMDGGVGLLMQVRVLSGAAQLFLPHEKVTEILTEFQIGNIEFLKGFPCVVSVDESKTVKFKRLIAV